MTKVKKVSLLFIVSLLSVLCFAVSAGAVESEWKKESGNHEVEYSFDAESGIFRLRGEGKVPAYYFGSRNSIPTDEEEFFGDVEYNSISEIADEVKILIIEEGITGTGKYSFSNLENLETVILPQSFTEIGYAGFNYCGNLRNINLPASLETIKAYAFSYCKSLANISFPSGIKKIDYRAFMGSGLEYAYIPEGVEYIGYDAFYGCDSLKKITFTNKIIEMTNCESLEEIVCPTDVTEESWCLGDDGNPYRIADNCPGLKRVVFPSYKNESNMKISLQSYDKFVADCPEVTLGYVSAEFIEKTGAEHAVITPEASEDKTGNIRYQIIPETGVMIVSGEGEVGKLLTGFCEKLNYDDYYDEDVYDEDYSRLYEIETIIFEEGITKIGHCAFLGKLNDIELLKNLETVVLPESLTEIDDYAFYNCSNLTKIYLPSELKSIGTYALAGTNIKQINIPDSVEAIGYGAFADTKIKSLTVPESVTNMREICNGCDNLKTVTFTNATCLIRGCDSLTKISYPSSLTKVEAIAENCPALQEVNFADVSADKKIKISVSDIDKFLPGCPEIALYLNNDIVSELDKNNINYAVITPTVSKLGKPSGFKHSQKGSTNKLTWSAVDGAGYYKLYYWNGSEWERVYCGAATQYNNPVDGKYRVRAVNYNGEKYVYGKYVTLQVNVVDPVSISGVTADGSNVTVKWSKGSDVTGYQLYYSLSPSSGFKKLVTTSNTSYTVKGLEEGKTYYFKVRAYSKSKNAETKYSTFSAVSAIAV